MSYLSKDLKIGKKGNCAVTGTNCIAAVVIKYGIVAEHQTQKESIVSSQENENDVHI